MVVKEVSMKKIYEDIIAEEKEIIKNSKNTINLCKKQIAIIDKH